MQFQYCGSIHLHSAFPINPSFGKKAAKQVHALCRLHKLLWFEQKLELLSFSNSYYNCPV